MIDVAIVGGGPNGLMLACELALAGVRPVVLERLTGPTTEQRANGLVGQVVTVLHRRGLFERLARTEKEPLPAPGFMFGAFPLDLRDLENNNLYTLMVPQREIQRMLTERAVELGVDIRLGHEVTGLDHNNSGVTIELDNRSALQAAFVVGADGGRSVVRKLAGIGFPGITTDDSVSRSGHVSVPDSMIDARGALVVPGYGTVPPLQHVRTERGVIVWAVLSGHPPLVSTIEFGQPAEGEASLPELAASASRVLGADVALGPPAGDGPHLMRRLAGGNTRLAERYRDGRVLLLGDAAHVHSALGGPGLNLGLQDAVNLGWKLAAEVQGRARHGLLDTYESERRPAAERVTMHTQAQSALIRPGAEVTALRVLFGELINSAEGRRHIADLLAGSDIRYDMGPATGPFVGHLAPGFPGLSDVTRTARPVLITPEKTGPGRIGAQEPGDTGNRVDVVVNPAAPVAMLLRPDGYVAWQDGTASSLEDAISAWMGKP